MLFRRSLTPHHRFGMSHKPVSVPEITERFEATVEKHQLQQKALEVSKSPSVQRRPVSTDPADSRLSWQTSDIRLCPSWLASVLQCYGIELHLKSFLEVEILCCDHADWKNGERAITGPMPIEMTRNYSSFRFSCLVRPV